MTEYTSSSDAVRLYTSAKQRTSAWVHNHAPYPDAQFHSPSIPPSPRQDLDPMPYATSDSDVESSHSLPPRMILRYPDGRDVRISHDYRRPKPPPAHAPDQMHRMPSHHSTVQVQHHPSERETAHSRPRSATHHLVSNSSSHHTASRDHISRSNSLMGPNAPLVAPQPSRPVGASFASPPPPSHHTLPSSRTSSHHSRPHTAHPTTIRPQEDIRVLPTRNSQSTVNASAHQSRNHTVQSRHSQVYQHGPSSHHSGRPSIVSPTPHRAYTPSHHTLLEAPLVAVSQSQPPIHVRDSSTPVPIAYSHSHPPSKHGNGFMRASTAAQSTFHYQPPPIVYAPSKHSNNTYAPPAIVYSPSSQASSSRNGQTGPSRHMKHTRAHSTSGTRSRTPVTRPPDSWFVIDENEALINRRREPRSHQYPRDRRHSQISNSSSSSESPALDDSSSRTPSSSSSGASQSTYYVIASPGQKVQLIIPDKSVHTDTSTSKNLMSPTRWSGAGSNGGLMRPFFDRLFRRNTDKRPAGPRGSGSKKVSRRHSTSGPLRRS